MRSPRPLIQIGFEKTSSRLQVPVKASTLRITASADLRWRDDSGDPTSEGHILKARQSFWYNGDPAKLRFSGEVTVTYYKS